MRRFSTVVHLVGNDDDRRRLLQLASEVLLLDQLKPGILVATIAMNKCWS